MGALQENLTRLRTRLRDAELAASRAPGVVQLLPVTKSVSAAKALELTQEGELELAENRISPLEEKARTAQAQGIDVRWHFIGHLQRNKARRVVKLAQVIHSVDSLRLLETLERIAEEECRRPQIYLEVQLTSEIEKHGFHPDEVPAALTTMPRLNHLDLKGIMVMGPRHSKDTPMVFARAQALAQTWQKDHPGAFVNGQCDLSMGMSGDLEIAVAAGSNLVRVGSALFREAAQDNESAQNNKAEGAA